MNFKFWEKPKVKKSQEKIFEEASVFIQNFKRKLEEANNLLNNSNINSSQSVLEEIEDLIIDMKSNLSQTESLMNQIGVGEDYFLIESSGEKDSLEMAHQEVLLKETPFAEYPQMKIDFERFKRDAVFKLAPSNFDEGIYQE